ncbi:Hsp90 protein-domain-containing protein [Mycena belliarum]|uniref:Hsp90 protein-domain-containing protein n=1 Tax=Mycena belliarum TaxID=1033014 RepID=A0AAD6UCI7_9AGAR|nr:Hsp90 protein-domain-containing protein [Mycena belliae]
MSAPPLPFGWSEHLSPTGQPYFFNVNTKESTYVRPLPPPMAPKKKEKPLVKTPIPGTDWLRVKTTEGNIFYSHKVKKESIWHIPDEIKAAVELLEAQELDREFRDAPPLAVSREINRVKSEVADALKRKAEEPVPVDEVVVSKKPKTGNGGSDDKGDESEEEEEWEQEAAAQLASEAEDERKRREEEEKRLKQEAEEEHQRSLAAQLNMPKRVDLSVEEAKALFKTLLREKDINPLHPWDAALPKFVSDPRYVLLSSVSARREAFDEYCRERAREIRQANVKKEKETVDPKEEFERFLKDEVKSTRTTWSDFRRTWKKDRRFYGWGRDDREREKRFRGWIRELGERKRAAAQKAETDFFNLLREQASINEGSAWKDVKRSLVDDPRYDAVGSSSLREELFNTFIKGNTIASTSQISSPSKIDDKPSVDEETHEEHQKKREERAKQAVKEREDKVRAELGRVEAEIGKSRQLGDKEEGEMLFKSMLTDAVRDPQMTWDVVVPLLSEDPRFRNSPLPLNMRLNLFHAHVGHLRAKQMTGLNALFETHAPTLATKFEALPLPALLGALPVTKLGLDVRSLQHEFEKWQRERTSECRNSFDEMLTENAFIEFWGKLKKIGGEGVDGGVKADELENEDEGAGGQGDMSMLGGRVDMKVLAKGVDVSEVEKVLKNDKRYIMFDHIPEQRELWIKRTDWIIIYALFLVHRSVGACKRGNFRCAPMRFLRPILLSLALVSSHVAAQDFDAPGVAKEKHSYQSDVARLRKIRRSCFRTNTSTNDRDIFLRELISNANDALEKLRLTALTDKTIWDGGDPLNVTIKTVKGEEGKGGRIIITDTGIGMSTDELTTNLGTLAKSGTSDFLAKAENGDGTGTGNLIGAFGLGFYSSFLVADRVYVASVPPKTAKNPNPVQHVFSSSADDSSYEVFPDPRGNTLGRGTEITLHLKEDALEYLDTDKLTALVNKHSSYSSTFPIYLFTQSTEEVPDEEAAQTPASEKTPEAAEETPKADKPKEPEDSDEAIVEEEVEVKKEAESLPPKMKTVVKDEWVQLNALPPLWMRDSKNISDEDYELFYTAFWKDFTKPLAWQHFSGDSESGVSFKSIIYLPGKFDDEYWKQPMAYKSTDIKLMVKRVFITSDLGEDVLPKWASWVKAVVDAEDLPLNVSRETLQSTRFLRQMKQIIMKRILQLFARIAEEDEDKFKKIVEVYGSVFKLGAVEDVKNRDKLIALTRFTTNQRNLTSLEKYLENKKQGQKQIFYLAEMGKSAENLAQSVFVEKLHARGYEVLLLSEPLDEILVQNLRHYKNVPFQDVAKAGLKFGDEELEAQEKEEKEEQEEKFQPLIKYLKNHSQDVVRDVVISNRLVTSPCAVVADSHGYTANIQRMMSASNAKSNQQQPYMHEFAKKAKVLEINPRSPLIEGLLRRVKQLPDTDEEPDAEAKAELDEVASILIDGALVRSGFEVPDSNIFFTRVDRVLRRSLGVSETAPTDTTVKPAPPVDPELPTEEFVEPQPGVDFADQFADNKPGIQLPDHMKDQVSIEMEEIDEDGNVVPPRDEL